MITQQNANDKRKWKFYCKNILFPHILRGKERLHQQPTYPLKHQISTNTTTLRGAATVFFCNSVLPPLPAFPFTIFLFS